MLKSLTIGIYCLGLGTALAATPIVQHPKALTTVAPQKATTILPSANGVLSLHVSSKDTLLDDQVITIAISGPQDTQINCQINSKTPCQFTHLPNGTYSVMAMPYNDGPEEYDAILSADKAKIASLDTTSINIHYLLSQTKNTQS